MKIRIVGLVVSLMSVLFSAPRALACGPFLCQLDTCLTYGHTSVDDSSENPCGSRSVAHLDPSNWTEENATLLAWELTALQPLAKR